MDKQLKKSHFYKFSLVCVCVFFCAYVIFSICADKGVFLHWQQRRKTGSCKKGYLLQNIYY